MGNPRKLTLYVIRNSSCHPCEHKLSGINCLLNRLHTYPITGKAKDAVKNTTKNIIYNNEYDTYLIAKPLPHQKKKNTHADSQREKTKWVTFTYSGKEVRRFTIHFQGA
jgi:hypothetical protein